MEVKLGLRVVRGPGWERGNEDGGEGYVGTVVAGGRAEDGRHDVATVQWDVGGERRVYRCGTGGKYDLRVIDSAPAGVVHRHWECSGCGSESIAGCVWRCVHCLRYYLCTPCYMKDRHSVWHHFMRIDSPENPRQRTRVQCRYQSSRVVARGVFVGARVVRGRDWKWGDQDGGVGREGTVVEMCGWQSESSRSVAVVEWRESGLKKKYRLGHKGKVDLQCTVAAEGGHCYLDHLPLLGGEYRASTPFICAGDIVRIEVDLDIIKSSHERLGIWDEKIANVIGIAGVVNYLDFTMKPACVFYPLRGYEVTLLASALKKVEGPDISIDDVVRVIDDLAEVHRLQKDARGWDDDMALSLGQLGRVAMLEDSGCVIVKVNGWRWVMDTSCLIPVPGEQPDDEQNDVEPLPTADLLWTSALKQPIPSVLDLLVTRGCSKMLAQSLEKWPVQVNAKFDNGSTLLHTASSEGRINCVRVLLQHKADITAKDINGEAPLHKAARFNHYQVAKLLLDEGSDVNVAEITGYTPLHVAAMLGYARLLQLFLNHPKCQVNAQNCRGQTALYFACRNYWPAIVQKLLHAGADVTLLSEQGRSPFIIAVMGSFYRGMELHLEMHPTIVNDVRLEDGCGPLHIAVFADDCDTVNLLASVEACDLNLPTVNTNQTPLHIAARDGHTKCVESLVGYGADLNATDALGYTPLHQVLEKQSMERLFEWKLYLNEFHEYVSGADNSIQDVPVYITVACFLVSEGASLETKSVGDLTPLGLCPPKYHSLLKLFARPERRGHYRGSLPRRSPLTQERKLKTAPTKTETTPTKTETTHTKTETTPSKTETTPTTVSVSSREKT